ncbi:activator of osmoprotectant transporter prop [Allofrancisella guangzhouensis]|uniref:Activator of osmoprotectant transporter prop n=1 Tax=Allofrancisella guangzhouensis TaxID=594679 RepID=A0A0A8E356_9GAMM|nr:ProQ/FINO family protein [Allofrancisella guangzhouensis]AJC48635.1 activator of osmoprotectant transporter prop [Allofrancisella guangzhouensis]MBK2026978.1 activator of osmoprotectant transporter prop [Allofrancisella guangzhouensis]MBK2044742.1 activator of osmoprotectant transporter prop [Allofrancisella guangzhouensis]MBK2045856.1 activator of osmoprotectant transporter prop [Allofrancisella guangzhouensis]
MSEGRNKLNDFSLLQSLIGGASKIEEKTSRMKQARDKNISKNKADSIKTPVKKIEDKDISFIRIPQYGHRISNKVVDELQNPIVEDSGELVITVDVEKERQKEEAKLFKWLCIRFPKCFDSVNKKPLKIGISEDIEIIYQNEHFAPIDKLVLRNVLRRYVGDTRYHRAVFELKQRFNLQGQPVEDYAPEHVEYSKRRLDEIAEKAEFRAKGLTMKDYYEYKKQQNAEDVETEE